MSACFYPDNCAETLTATAAQTSLPFHALTLEDVPAVAPLLTYAPSRTNDFSIGGIFMWADYFRYEGALLDDTLFIRGLSENDLSRTAYSLPVGRLPLERSIALLRRHAESAGEPLLLSAVPMEAIPSLEAMGGRVVAELADWADYLYDANMLATLSGKKMSKKRNHVNAFMHTFPTHGYEPLTQANAARVREFYESMPVEAGKGVTAEVERLQTLRVLDHLPQLPFSGAVLTVPGQGVVAFTLGEVIGDTMYVHIEKMRHDIPGAGETINHLFAAEMTVRRGLRFINREEDTGDEGLRRAKLSYHPVQILRKFDVEFS